ncbi:MAG: hypothetical protein E6G62_03765, partial [Actinobacteria bacterium]
MALFAIVFFRLWFLQVLSGEQYVQQADANRVRDLPIAAPRGEILDRAGQPLVASRTTNAVQIVPSALPPEGAPRLALYRRLGGLLGLSPAGIEALVVHGRSKLRYAPVTIKTDAGPGVLTVLGERQNEFPGVVQQPVSIRAYPYGEMAAQVLGYVGQVSKPELKMRAFNGVQQGTVVGQEGLEYYYDRYLRGEAGVQRVEVNAEGYPVASRLSPKLPHSGHSLRVTLDVGLQKASEKALLDGIEHARGSGKPANAGAFVAMDPRNGQILSIGSYPSFDPNRFAKPLTDAQWSAHRSRRQRHLSHGLDLQAHHRNGRARIGRARSQRRTGRGPVHLGVDPAVLQRGPRRLRRCEPRGRPEGVLGHLLLRSGRAGQQPWRRDPAQGQGTRHRTQDRHRPARRAHGNRPQPPVASPSERRRAQMPRAHAPAELRNRGRNPSVERRRQHAPRRRPGGPRHLAAADGGRLLHARQRLHARGRRHRHHASPGARGRRRHRRSRAGTEPAPGAPRASQRRGFESRDGRDSRQHPVYGKTGTAQREPKEDQSWYMCYVGDPQRPIVIAVTVEQGGFGAETAAPIARLIASRWFGKTAKFVAGTSKTR